MSVYSGRIVDELAASIDTTRLAEAWQALHPKDVGKSEAGRDSNPRSPISGGYALGPLRLPHGALSAWPPASQGKATKAIPPELSAFLGAARNALTRALKTVLTKLWTEAWVLGNRSAQAVVDGLDPDWGDWTPGDYAAAEQIAGLGLRQLLDEAGIRIKSIADSRLEELSAVLEETLRSDEILRPELPAPLPPYLSVADLAKRLEDVLDNPRNAELVAQAEIARAQASAARQVYLETGRSEVEVSTAEDDKVCPICEAAAAAGAHPVGSPPMVPLHPRCRCAELPVLEGV